MTEDTPSTPPIADFLASVRGLLTQGQNLKTTIEDRVGVLSKDWAVLEPTLEAAVTTAKAVADAAEAAITTAEATLSKAKDTAEIATAAYTAALGAKAMVHETMSQHIVELQALVTATA